MVTNDGPNQIPIFDEKYPARRVLNLISQRWTPIVIYCLSGGVRRFGQIESQIPGISKKMLAQVLRQLEADGVVNRKVYAEVPPRTEYKLTRLGERLHEPIRLLCDWALENSPTLNRIETNRRKSAESS